MSLGSLGCELPSADGSTGRDSRKRAYPAFVMQQGDMAVAMFPQSCVGTAHGYRWPDTLVVAARGGRRVTAVVELDGAPYHGNRDAEKRRDRNISSSACGAKNSCLVLRGERFACGCLRGGQAGIVEKDL